MENKTHPNTENERNNLLLKTTAAAGILLLLICSYLYYNATNKNYNYPQPPLPTTAPKPTILPPAIWTK